MHAQKGNFNGIDTISVNMFGDFSKCSYLAAESKSRSICFCPDTNALLTTLVEERKMSNCVANSKQEEAVKLTGGIDFTKYFYRATYVLLQSAMHMQSKISKYEEVEIVIDTQRDDNNDRLPDLNIKIQTFWPEHIYPCQHYNKYGCIFASVPSYKPTSRNNDPPNGTTLRNLWILSSLLTGLQPLWISVLSKKHYRTSQWYGWILAYLCKKCFRNVSTVQQRNDTYKKSLLTLCHAVGKKFESCANTDAMKNILNDISKIKFVDCSEMVENMLPLRDIIENIDCDEMTEVIIVDEFYFLENEDVEFEPVMNGIEYELCCICDVWMTSDDNWDGIVWRHHGGVYGNFWKQKRTDFIPVQCDDVQDLFKIDASHTYTLGV
jgi:hypothetical protein